MTLFINIQDLNSWPIYSTLRPTYGDFVQSEILLSQNLLEQLRKTVSEIVSDIYYLPPVWLHRCRKQCMKFLHCGAHVFSLGFSKSSNCYLFNLIVEGNVSKFDQSLFTPWFFWSLSLLIYWTNILSFVIYFTSFTCIISFSSLSSFQNTCNVTKVKMIILETIAADLLFSLEYQRYFMKAGKIQQLWTHRFYYSISRVKIHVLT